MIEVPNVVGGGVVQFNAGKIVNIEGCMFKVETVLNKTKKIHLGVVPYDTAKTLVQKTQPSDVKKPKLEAKGKKVDPKKLTEALDE